MTIPATTARKTINDCWNKIGVWGKGDCPDLERFVHCRNCPVYSGAAIALLDSELPGHYLNEWTEYFAKPKKVEAADTHSVVIFRVGAEWLAVATAVLKEVSELRRIHSLPHRRSRMVLGVVNIRGELLVCVSLAELLGLDKTPETQKGRSLAVHERLLVVSREGSRLVFPVQEVYGIHRFHPNEAREVPATIAKATATYTKGVLSWQNKSVGWMDDQLLFYSLNRSLA